MRCVAWVICLQRTNTLSEASDTRLALWTATFRNPELEAEFKLHHKPQTDKHLRFTASFGAFYFVMFWLTDLAAIGYNDTTRWLLVGRLLVAVFVVVGLHLVARYPRSLIMPTAVITFIEVFTMGVFILIVDARATEMYWHGMSMGTMLLVVYLFIPNAFLPATLVAVMFSVAFAVLAIDLGQMESIDQVTLIVELVFMNGFGLLAAHRQHSLARQEFLARRIERRALATQRQFVAMLSHEFRTPLAIIDTVGQRLELTLRQSQPHLVPRVEKIRRAVSRLLGLLNNCLTEERLAASELVLHPEPVDLHTFIMYCYGEGGALASPRLQLLLPDGPQWVSADRHLLDIALANLVGNAFKYSPADQPVILSLWPEVSTGQIMIQVEDRGDGIPAAERERVFNKFFRCDPNHGVPGAGLGLYLARDLIRRHGGDVRLAPQREGVGAVFVVSLPASAPMHEVWGTER